MSEGHKIGALKRRLIKDYLKRLEPFMWESGWIKNTFEFDKPKIYTRLVTLKNDKTAVIRNNGNTLDVIAICDDGVMTDAYGGGAAVTPFNELWIEQLIKLETVVTRLEEEYK